MKTRSLMIAAAMAASLAGVATRAPLAEAPARIVIDYPEEGSIFPPDITAPMFLWRDPQAQASVWRIDVEFTDGSAALRARSTGERMRIGEIDPRSISDHNQLPTLTPQQAAARTWRPDPETWAAIRIHSAGRPATVTITGFSGRDPAAPVSRGRVTLETSRDPVGAPIFYRDVPLMPSELERGVIKPLAPSAVPLIAWRLRNLAEPASRLVMEGLPTCANCHSFSRDGKTMGMDVDGPANDKGTYALVAVKPQTTIRSRDVITWNSFPGKPAGQRTVGFLAQVSPDGRWIVFVQCRNGQLMRPDSQLYIAPAPGGAARRMRCNTALMNSWHSFSPNGRWLVFSSKSRSPYTQMFLTHLDEEGRDSPPILIENATAANRAVNLPEFVNLRPDGLTKIDVPAADFYRLFDRALQLAEKGQDDAAIAAWNKALEMDRDSAKAHNNLGVLLSRKGKFDQAMAHFRRATELKPDYAEAHYSLGRVFQVQGRMAEALAHWREARRIAPNEWTVLNQTAWALATSPDDTARNGAEAVRLAERAVELTGRRQPETLDTLAAAYAEAGRFPEAVQAARRALAVAAQQSRRPLVEALTARIRLYEANTPFRDRPQLPPGGSANPR